MGGHLWMELAHGKKKHKTGVSMKIIQLREQYLLV